MLAPGLRCRAFVHCGRFCFVEVTNNATIAAIKTATTISNTGYMVASLYGFPIGGKENPPDLLHPLYTIIV
jgi:hypothetical protein